MPKRPRNVDVFCKRPEDQRATAKARNEWKKLVQATAARTLKQFIDKPLQEKTRSQFKLLKALDAVPPETVYESVTKSLGRFKRYIELVQGDIGTWRAKMVGLLTAEDTVHPVFTQEFDGVVTSTSDTAVTIEFTVEGEPEVRSFALADLDAPGYELRKGQAVRARCQLEILPTTKPMSGEEIKEWKEQYRDVRGYRKKARRGKSLLEGDEV